MREQFLYLRTYHLSHLISADIYLDRMANIFPVYERIFCTAIAKKPSHKFLTFFDSARTHLTRKPNCRRAGEKAETLRLMCTADFQVSSASILSTQHEVVYISDDKRSNSDHLLRRLPVRCSEP